ncbi:xanthine dehydrogenase family protein subunit M [Limibaculum sp. FT325]|uniref:FAD binding domain-containing protein n=1 Tax=Thermohalobaculum sediminis TaxID=2939436 RepID=UPI0020C0E0FB|nr:xanthine dehydrogenase family protein subunit M [Limibaculum sediminis]MCL5778042.1 xanthine dehydrogenase family protein subunit M [Limibaculum sediminis]
MYAFDYTRPASLAEAIEAMRGDEAKALAGGQTLIPTLKQRLASPATLVDLTGITEIRGICLKDGAVSVGAGTRHAEVAASADVRRLIPALSHLAGHIGDPQVRNRGTLGGSLANNDPSACYPAAVLGLGATVHTSAGRAIAADDYFQGMFTTALDEGELITSVDFPVPEKAAYMKFVQPASRFALTGVFVAKFAGGVRVAVTGASEGGVFRWAEAEAALGRSFAVGALDGVEASPDGMIGDLHGTPEYRAHLVGVMTRRAVEAAA